MNDLHIIPNNNKNIRLAIQQDKECQNIFNQYKITSEKYNKLKGINNTYFSCVNNNTNKL